MIVKVQLSIESNIQGHTTGSRMLIYNKSKSVAYETAADPAVVSKMKGRVKDFFYAVKVDKINQHSEVIIGDLAPWQNW